MNNLAGWGFFAIFVPYFSRMSQLDSIKSSLADELARLNALIHSCLSSNSPMMDSVIESHLRATGKQIRPVVVMLCARIFAPVSERVLNAAAAVELLHNASLIHDDVVDESKLRRGLPTVNALWDNHIAVLVGDFFVSTALQRAIATGDMRIVEAVGELGKLLSLGEIDQIYNAREHGLSEEAYYHIINFKTASLFVACARVGCFAAGADEASTSTLARVAEQLGLCFQIRDDVFDYFEAEKVGKPTGNDLREGKITLPLLHALEMSGDSAMVELSAKDNLSDEDVKTLQQFARDNGGIDYAYESMNRLRNQAAELLAALPEGAEDLLALFDYIIARDF